jgi:hypothetical protein
MQLVSSAEASRRRAAHRSPRELPKVWGQAFVVIEASARTGAFQSAPAASGGGQRFAVNGAGFSMNGAEIAANADCFMVNASRFMENDGRFMVNDGQFMVNGAANGPSPRRREGDWILYLHR